nr:MAG TPA: hypothetical protein [Caudoviricetes sp.]
MFNSLNALDLIAFLELPKQLISLMMYIFYFDLIYLCIFYIHL